MHYRFFRSLAALGLIFSLWAGSLTAVAAPRGGSRTRRRPSRLPRTRIRRTRRPATRKARKSPLPRTPSNSGKPLSEKEDPRLIGKRKINGGFINSISGGVDKEVALGRQLAAEVDRQAKFVDDPVITEYINRVGQNVVLHSDAQIPFTIKVIDSDEVNAFALPGGFFYVNKGLILAADNEAEVAGVMAHEIAHVTARHAMENQAKGMLAEIGLLAGSIFLGGTRRDAHQAGRAVRRAPRLHEVQPQRRVGGRHARRAVHVGRRVRPERDVHDVREAGGEEQEEARHLLEALRVAPAVG